MATQKGLSPSLIVQIVTHLSMTKVTKFEEKIFSCFWVMLEKPLGGVNSIPLSRNRVKDNELPFKQATRIRTQQNDFYLADKETRTHKVLIKNRFL